MANTYKAVRGLLLDSVQEACETERAIQLSEALEAVAVIAFTEDDFTKERWERACALAWSGCLGRLRVTPKRK